MDRPVLPLPHSLERHGPGILGMLEPSIDLEAGAPGEDAAPEASRLFGSPWLHHVGDWPRTPEGRPMAFIAQCALGDLPEEPREARILLPESGLLQLFYDLDALPPGRDAEDRYRFRVLWTPDLEGARRIEPPPGAAEAAVSERALRGLPSWRLPSEADRRYALDELGEEEYLAYEALSSGLGAAGGHRLLGPADWLEGDAREDCAGATAHLWRSGPDDWRLLWQVAGDPDLDEALGDEVRLYVMIRDEDLRAARFLRAWVVMQGL
ncbi:MAG: DUF1963 domain-containing protein [Planctomycetes bacterium]|nr:DUF1963 domain-containing protein [Planctomycetota bacterium]